MQIPKQFMSAFFNEFVAIDFIDTLAYRLARIYRFCGESPISVALHSLLVAELVRQAVRSNGFEPRVRWTSVFMALMHDAHETMLTDIPTPVASLFDKNYDNCIKDAKAQIDEYIYERCFHNFAGTIPGAIRDDAAYRASQADDCARSYEYGWLKDNGKAIHNATSSISKNLYIQTLISKTIVKSRVGGVFERIDSEAIAYDWSNPHAIHTLWEQQTRIAIENLHTINNSVRTD